MQPSSRPSNPSSQPSSQPSSEPSRPTPVPSAEPTVALVLSVETTFDGPLNTDACGPNPAPGSGSCNLKSAMSYCATVSAQDACAVNFGGSSSSATPTIAKDTIDLDFSSASDNRRLSVSEDYELYDESSGRQLASRQSKTMNIDGKGAVIVSGTENKPFMRLFKPSSSSLFVTVRISNLTLTNFSSSAGNASGCINIDNVDAVIFENVNFVGCVGVRGGAIYASRNSSMATSTSLLISKCHFIGNQAMIGGAVFAYDTSVTVTQNNFTNNLASFYGGAVTIIRGTSTIKNNVFVSNFASKGSAVAVHPSRVPSTVQLNYFSSNIAAIAGTVFWVYYVDKNEYNKEPIGLTSNIMSNNTAGLWGPRFATEAAFLKSLEPSYDVDEYDWSYKGFTVNVVVTDYYGTPISYLSEQADVGLYYDDPKCGSNAEPGFKNLVRQ